MKRMAGMQPYFFPYIGYWQLIDAVDCFVLFDDAQYIKQGWVNRNRILKPGGGWQYIHVPVARHPMASSIRDVGIANTVKWKTRILNQLSHYKHKARHFEETREAVDALLNGGDDETIGALNCRIIRQLCVLLSIESEIIVSSAHGFDYSSVSDTDDWALAHARGLGATELLNPAGGFALLDAAKFKASGIELSRLEQPAVFYAQCGEPFEPSLSIIDVMMFNGVQGTRAFLSERRIMHSLEREAIPDSPRETRIPS